MKHSPLSFSACHSIPVKPETRAVKTIDIQGTPVVNENSNHMIDRLINTGAKRCFFLNAHCANVKAKSTDYASALSRAEYVLPDGIGIELAARMMGQQITENLNGTDFVPALLKAAAKNKKSVFLLGGLPGIAQQAADKLQKEIPELNIIGCLDGYGGGGTDVEIVRKINESDADILLVAMGVPTQELWIDRNADLLKAELIMGVGALFDFLSERITRAPSSIRQCRLEWAWRLVNEPARLWQRYLVGNFTFIGRSISYAWSRGLALDLARYGFDSLFTILALTLLWPVFLLIAIAIKLDDGGPVFFMQQRVGRHGRLFNVYKFRSMVPDAERRQSVLTTKSDRSGICFKQSNDPRMTRVGQFIRRYSLDELPQLFNVLRSEMSLVGPRPALSKEVSQYPSHALERLAVKPGITGVWQVAGRADISFDKMVDMDIAYVRSRSLVLDLILLVMTMHTVASGRGAY